MPNPTLRQEYRDYINQIDISQWPEDLSTDHLLNDLGSFKQDFEESHDIDAYEKGLRFLISQIETQCKKKKLLKGLPEILYWGVDNPEYVELIQGLNRFLPTQATNISSKNLKESLPNINTSFSSLLHCASAFRDINKTAVFFYSLLVSASLINASPSSSLKRANEKTKQLSNNFDSNILASSTYADAGLIDPSTFKSSSNIISTSNTSPPRKISEEKRKYLGRILSTPDYLEEVKKLLNENYFHIDDIVHEATHSTLLCFAAQQGMAPLVNLCLEKGADPFIANGAHQYPLLLSYVFNNNHLKNETVLPKSTQNIAAVMRKRIIAANPTIDSAKQQKRLSPQYLLTMAINFYDEMNGRRSNKFSYAIALDMQTLLNNKEIMLHFVKKYVSDPNIFIESEQVNLLTYLISTDDPRSTPAILALLEKKGIDTNTEHESEGKINTPLGLAISHNQAEVVAALISNPATKISYRHLAHAYELPEKSLLSLLLKNLDRVSVKDIANTIVHTNLAPSKPDNIAVTFRKALLSRLEKLLDEKYFHIDDYLDEENNTLLHYAARSLNEEFTRLCFSYEANPLIENKENALPLLINYNQEAARRGLKENSPASEMIKLNAFAIASRSNYHSVSADEITRAAFNFWRLLASQDKKSIEEFQEEHYFSLFRIATIFRNERFLAHCVTYFFDDVNALVNDGNSDKPIPLSLAVARHPFGRLANLALIKKENQESKPNTEIISQEKFERIISLARQNSEEALLSLQKLLVEKYFSINDSLDTNQQTLLHYAASQKLEKTLKFCLDFNADPFVINKQHQYPILLSYATDDPNPSKVNKEKISKRTESIAEAMAKKIKANNPERDFSAYSQYLSVEFLTKSAVIFYQEMSGNPIQKLDYSTAASLRTYLNNPDIMLRFVEKYVIDPDTFIAERNLSLLNILINDKFTSSSALALIRMGANPNIENNDEGIAVTPLYLAIIRDNHEVVTALLAQPTTKIFFNHFLSAIENNDLRFLELLLENLAKSDSDTIIQVIDYAKKEELKSKILNASVQYFIKTVSSETKNFSFLGRLISRGFDINQTIDTDKNRLLHLAAKMGNFELSQFLLRQGANPCLENSDDKLAVFISYHRDNPNLKKAKDEAVHLSELTELHAQSIIERNAAINIPRTSIDDVIQAAINFRYLLKSHNKEHIAPLKQEKYKSIFTIATVLQSERFLKHCVTHFFHNPSILVNDGSSNKETSLAFAVFSHPFGRLASLALIKKENFNPNMRNPKSEETLLSQLIKQNRMTVIIELFYQHGKLRVSYDDFINAAEKLNQRNRTDFFSKVLKSHHIDDISPKELEKFFKLYPDLKQHLAEEYHELATEKHWTFVNSAPAWAWALFFIVFLTTIAYLVWANRPAQAKSLASQAKAKSAEPRNESALSIPEETLEKLKEMDKVLHKIKELYPKESLLDPKNTEKLNLLTDQVLEFKGRVSIPAYLRSSNSNTAIPPDPNLNNEIVGFINYLNGFHTSALNEKAKAELENHRKNKEKILAQQAASIRTKSAAYLAIFENREKRIEGEVNPMLSQYDTSEIPSSIKSLEHQIESSQRSDLLNELDKIKKLYAQYQNDIENVIMNGKKKTNYGKVLDFGKKLAEKKQAINKSDLPNSSLVNQLDSFIKRINQAIDIQSIDAMLDEADNKKLLADVKLLLNSLDNEIEHLNAKLSSLDRGPESIETFLSHLNDTEKDKLKKLKEINTAIIELDKKLNKISLQAKDEPLPAATAEPSDNELAAQQEDKTSLEEEEALEASFDLPAAFNVTANIDAVAPNSGARPQISLPAWQTGEDISAALERAAASATRREEPKPTIKPISITNEAWRQITIQDILDKIKIWKENLNELSDEDSMEYTMMFYSGFYYLIRLSSALAEDARVKDIEYTGLVVSFSNKLAHQALRTLNKDDLYAIAFIAETFLTEREGDFVKNIKNSELYKKLGGNLEEINDPSELLTIIIQQINQMNAFFHLIDKQLQDPKNKGLSITAAIEQAPHVLASIIMSLFIINENWQKIKSQKLSLDGSLRNFINECGHWRNLLRHNFITADNMIEVKTILYHLAGWAGEKSSTKYNKADAQSLRSNLEDLAQQAPALGQGTLKTSLVIHRPVASSSGDLGVGVEYTP